MTDKVKKSQKKTAKYKAVDPVEFKSNYNKSVPGYEQLSKGESIEYQDNKYFETWLNTNIIIKE